MLPLYDSAAARTPAIEELSELWRYRDLLRLLIIKSIKTRYKRSLLGVAWTLLNPLLTTLVLTIAFSQLMRFQIDDYPIYLLVGLLTWNFFAQTTTQSMYNLIWGGSLLKRIYVPRTIFTVAVLGNGLVNYLLGLIPLTLLMLVMERPFTTALLLLPVAILLLAMFTLVISLLLSALAVVFVDIVDIFSVLLSAWFFLTPIIYPIEVVPKQFAPLIRLNPMTIMVELFRSILYFGQIPPLPLLGAATLLAVVFLVSGWWYYTRHADELAYRL